MLLLSCRAAAALLLPRCRCRATAAALVLPRCYLTAAALLLAAQPQPAAAAAPQPLLLLLLLHSRYAGAARCCSAAAEQAPRRAAVIMMLLLQSCDTVVGDAMLSHVEPSARRRGGPWHGTRPSPHTIMHITEMERVEPQRPVWRPPNPEGAMSLQRHQSCSAGAAAPPSGARGHWNVHMHAWDVCNSRSWAFRAILGPLWCLATL